MTTTIEKRSSNKTVDAYRSTAPQEIDGRWVVITKYQRGLDDQGMYRHVLTVRDATPDEVRKGTIAALKRRYDAMGNSPGVGTMEDHVAAKRALDNQIRALEGRPSLEEEWAAARAARAAGTTD
mgnify:FL=1